MGSRVIAALDECAEGKAAAVSGIPADRCKMPQAFWRAFSEAGLKPSVILRQARLPVMLHLKPQALMSTAQIFAIYKAAEVLTDDPGFAIKFVKAFDRSGHQPAFLGRVTPPIIATRWVA
jgi:hypothetical protein